MKTFYVMALGEPTKEIMANNRADIVRQLLDMNVQGVVAVVNKITEKMWKFELKKNGMGTNEVTYCTDSFTVSRTGFNKRHVDDLFLETTKDPQEL